MKRALITGITGQDGSYLAEFLLSKPDYEVHGLVRRSSSLNRQRIDHLFTRDRIDRRAASTCTTPTWPTPRACRWSMEQVRPDEVYNLGAQSHVRVSFDQPLYTADVVGLGTLRLLEAVRQLNRSSRSSSTRRPARRCSARRRRRRGSTRRSTPAAPTPAPSSTPTGRRSTTARPTACSPARASCSTTRARAAASRSSPARSPSGATRIKEGLQKKLVMGNLDAKRDWGFAGDYVRAMWLMLQQDKPDDYVVATGETYSVREFLELAFSLPRPRLPRLRRVRPEVHPALRGRRPAGRRDQGPRRCSAGSPRSTSAAWSR